MKQPSPHHLAEPNATGSSPRTTVQQTYIMTNRNGLHARPCSLLVKTLHPFACEVKVEHGNALASGNRIFGLMVLTAGYESKLTFTIGGKAAARAMAAVRRLFETRFQEAYALEQKVGVA